MLRVCVYLRLMSVSNCSRWSSPILVSKKTRWIHTKSRICPEKREKRFGLVCRETKENLKEIKTLKQFEYNLIFSLLARSRESFSHKDLCTTPSRTHVNRKRSSLESGLLSARGPPKSTDERNKGDDMMKDYIHHFPFICRWIIPNKLLCFGVSGDGKWMFKLLWRFLCCLLKFQ